MTAQMERTRSQELVSEELFDSIVNQVARDTGVETDRAVRQVGEALKYLQLVADNPGAGYAVSPEVDHGWHGFILHTRAYQQFCKDLTGGSFIHHNPTPNYGTAKKIGETVAAMCASGMRVDHEIWDGTSSCSCCKPAAPCGSNIA